MTYLVVLRIKHVIADPDLEMLNFRFVSFLLAKTTIWMLADCCADLQSFQVFLLENLCMHAFLTEMILIPLDTRIYCDAMDVFLYAAPACHSEVLRCMWEARPHRHASVLERRHKHPIQA